MTIPRSTQAERGRLAGAAPVARQVRQVTVRLEQIQPGVLRLSQPGAPGWQAVARTPWELARAAAAAFTEAQCAAYSTFQGRLYNGADPQARPGRRKPLARRSAHRSDTHDPREWLLADDGRWLSPGGRCYPESAQVVQRVRARRLSMGLPPAPDAVSGRTEVLRGHGGNHEPTDADP